MCLFAFKGLSWPFLSIRIDNGLLLRFRLRVKDGFGWALNLVGWWFLFISVLRMGLFMGMNLIVILESTHVHVLLEFHELFHFGLGLDCSDVLPQPDLQMLEV